MNVLIAEDDDASRRLLETVVRLLGHGIVSVADGPEAWRVFAGEAPPRLALLDWGLPGLSGLEICRRLRERRGREIPWIIMVTARTAREDLVAGLSAGADDYVTKPISPEELGARITAGIRTLALRDELAERVKELEAALAEVKLLRGLLPICSYCKRIRDEKDSWQPIERYIIDRSDAKFTHGICPDCRSKFVTPLIDKVRRERQTP